MLKSSMQLEGVGFVLEKFQSELNDTTNGGSTLNRLFRTCIRETLLTVFEKGDKPAMHEHEFWCDGDVIACFAVGQIDYLRLDDDQPFYDQDNFIGYETPDEDYLGTLRSDSLPVVRSIIKTISLVLMILYYFNDISFDEFVSATNGHWRATKFKGKGPHFSGIAKAVAEVLFPKAIFQGFSRGTDLFIREYVRLRDVVRLKGRQIAEEMENNLPGFLIKGSTPTEYFDLDQGKSFRNIYYRNSTRNTQGKTKTTQTTQPQ